ncbi:MAG: M64 family metallopeptidase [Alistipes sp.]
MKIKFYLLLVSTWLCLLASCSKEESVNPDFSFASSTESMTLAPQQGTTLTVEFTSALDWSVSADVEWIALSVNSGPRGKNSVLITANQQNEAGDVRTGNLIFVSGSHTETIQIQQTSIDLLKIDKTEFKVISEGKDIKITFATNVAFETLRVKGSDGIDKWIEIITPQSDTRALQTGSLNLRIKENRSQDLRKALFRIVSVDSNENVVLESAIVSISQDGVPVQTSTDFSEDGKWKVLQKHSQGNGIPLVIMGDGFVDKDIASGFYDEVMEQAGKNFFTEEPVKSLREYFDIWVVRAVSKNNSFTTNYATVFECKIEGGNSTGITGNHETVVKYIQNVTELRTLEKLEEATVIVVLNSSAYAGTTYWGFGFREERPLSNLSIGYCPIIDGALDSEYFRRVLCHECIGHGFAKLLDEYSYQSNGTIPANLIENYQNYQSLLGWGLNVDFTPVRSKVRWKHFFEDSRYTGKDAVEQTLGVYEGACTYWTGAWRPTEESMMRNNINGFNAPSREVIYRRAMMLANGADWQYNYEDFVLFDQAHLPQLHAQTRAQQYPSTPFEPVRIANQILTLKQ